jgi:hypothetical protein
MAAHVAHVVTRLTLIVSHVARIISHVPVHGLGVCHRSNAEKEDHREKAYDELFVFAINHVNYPFLRIVDCKFFSRLPLLPVYTNHKLKKSQKFL